MAFGKSDCWTVQAWEIGAAVARGQRKYKSDRHTQWAFGVYPFKGPQETVFEMGDPKMVKP